MAIDPKALPLQRPGEKPPLFTRKDGRDRWFAITDESRSPKNWDLYGARGAQVCGYPIRLDGTSVCRWCYGELSGRRTSWCSDACFREYSLRFNWSFLRSEFLKVHKECAHCGAIPERPNKLEIDHITPIIEGGDNRPSNLRLLCTECHKVETKALMQRRRAS